MSRGILHESNEVSELSVADRIQALIHARKWSQAKLAEKLGISQAAVQKFISGNGMPSERSLLHLGNISDPPDCWYYWQLAGLDLRRVERLMSKEASQLDDENKQRTGMMDHGTVTSKEAKILSMPRNAAVQIPILKDAAAAGIPRFIDERLIDGYLGILPDMCPHPEHTVCLRVNGDSMSPVLEEGYLVLVDAFTQEVQDLRNEMVVASDPEGAVTIKWLRHSGRYDILEPQHTSPRYPPVVISGDPGWRIIGRVIWWVGKPRGRK